MADSFLVHERNLDPELRAKVNGIKQGDLLTIWLRNNN